MKKLIVFLLIVFISFSTQTFSRGIKKDNRELMIEQALNAEKRKNFESAFFNFERLMFYYAEDEVALKSYAQFCERNNFNKKAAELYLKLYEISGNPNYLKKLNKYKKPIKKKISPPKKIKKPPSKVTKTPPKSKHPIKTVPSIEEKMYAALRNNDFKTAQTLLNKLSKTNPNNLKYIRLQADVALALKDFKTAIIYLNKLNLNKTDLENLEYCYYELKDYENALKINARLLELSPNNEKYLKNQGDLYSIKKDYLKATENYEKLVKIYPKEDYYFTLTDLYLASNDYPKAEKTIKKIYNSNADVKIAQKYLHILLTQNKLEEALEIANSSNLLESQEGLKLQADLAFKQEDFNTAREFYRKLLEQNPTFEAAQIGIVNSHIANAENLQTLLELDRLNQTDDVKFLKAKTYYNMQLYTQAKNILKKLKQTDEVYELQNDIQKARAYRFDSGYSLFTQTLSEEYKLNANKIGISNSAYIDNLKTSIDYKLYIYSSGIFNYASLQGRQNNVTNEIKGGVEGRINEKIAIKANIGVKIFQDAGAMINTDSWIKYYVNDGLNLKLGFYRDNVEQSYLSAVGLYLDGIYTGQVAENKLYLEFDKKLPNKFYSFGRVAGGIMAGQNLDNNPYLEGMLGIGKLLYYNETNPYIKKITADLVSYNSSYTYNQLNIYDKSGNLYGGYWSPAWFTANTVNLNAEGEIKKLNLTYGVGGFGGWQYAIRPVKNAFTWGALVYLNYALNDYIDINAQYRYFNYASVQRNQFSINLIIKGFKHVKKN